jgi:predicted PurR-regulated permease PerM
VSLASLLDRDRNRAAWWLYLGFLGLGVAFLGYSFLGTFVFGVFIYYASRPVFRRVRSRLNRDGLSAGVTLLGFVVPVLLIVGYVLVAGLRDVASLSGVGPDGYAQLLSPFVNVETLGEGQRDALATLLNRPGQLQSLPLDRLRSLLTSGLAVLGSAMNVLVHVSLAFGLAYFLLRDGESVAEWFRRNVAPPDSAGHAYARAVDDDLETVFFGNVVFVFTMALLAAAVYYGFNLVAPSALGIPFPILLALLTGITSLIPLVVSKVVYVPLVVYLGAIAVRTGGVALVFPVGLLVVSFLLLDILPQTFLQPYISGRQIHTGIMMFAYLLGPLLFGWYGFFLLPILFVLMLEAVRIVLPELVHGEAVTPAVEMGDSVGTTPRTDVDAVPDESVASDDGTTTGDGDASRDASGDGPSERSE